MQVVEQKGRRTIQRTNRFWYDEKAKKAKKAKNNNNSHEAKWEHVPGYEKCGKKEDGYSVVGGGSPPGACVGERVKGRLESVMRMKGREGGYKYEQWVQSCRERSHGKVHTYCCGDVQEAGIAQ